MKTVRLTITPQQPYHLSVRWVLDHNPPVEYIVDEPRDSHYLSQLWTLFPPRKDETQALEVSSQKDQKESYERWVREHGHRQGSVAGAAFTAGHTGGLPVPFRWNRPSEAAAGGVSGRV